MRMATFSSAIATDVHGCVRAATLDDASAIAALYGDAVLHGTASYETEPPDAPEMVLRMRAVLDAGLPFLAADLDGRMAGYAFASPYRTRAGYRWTVEDTVYVASDAQGRGVGRALLARLIVDCERLGYRQMIAVIGDGTNNASIALHAAQGFREVGRFPGIGRKFGRWLDGVQMIRPLGDGTASAPPDERQPA